MRPEWGQRREGTEREGSREQLPSGLPQRLTINLRKRAGPETKPLPAGPGWVDQVGVASPGRGLTNRSWVLMCPNAQEKCEDLMPE